MVADGGGGGAGGATHDKLYKYTKKMKTREHPANTYFSCVIQWIFIFTQILKLSYGRYAHFVIRASQKQWTNDEFGKRGMLLKDNSKASNVVFL